MKESVVLPMFVCSRMSEFDVVQRYVFQLSAGLQHNLPDITRTMNYLLIRGRQYDLESIQTGTKTHQSFSRCFIDSNVQLIA